MPDQMPSRRSIQEEMQAVFDQRAQQIDDARTETPFEKQQRIGGLFADAVRDRTDQLGPQTITDDDQPQDLTTFAAAFQRFLDTQEK